VLRSMHEGCFLSIVPINAGMASSNRVVVSSANAAVPRKEKMKDTATKNQRRSAWPVAGKVAAAAWLLIVLVSVLRGYVKAPSFEEATKEDCSQLLISVYQPFENLFYKYDGNRYPQMLYWKDGRSGKEIIPYRRGMKSLDCDSLDRRVALFAQASKSGLIEPVIAVNWVRTILMMLVPSALFLVFAYLMGSRTRKPG
jgi:hypothetical protein